MNINNEYEDFTVKDILKKIEQCDSFHNRCDYLLDHSEIDYILDYVRRLEQEVIKLQTKLEVTGVIEYFKGSDIIEQIESMEYKI